jgi:hypothetical protein
VAFPVASAAVTGVTIGKCANVRPTVSFHVFPWIIVSDPTRPKRTKCVDLLELTATAFRLATLRTLERAFAFASVDQTLYRHQRRGAFELESVGLGLREATGVFHFRRNRVE